MWSYWEWRFSDRKWSKVVPCVTEWLNDHFWPYFRQKAYSGGILKTIHSRFEKFSKLNFRMWNILFWCVSKNAGLNNVTKAWNNKNIEIPKNMKYQEILITGNICVFKILDDWWNAYIRISNFFSSIESTKKSSEQGLMSCSYLHVKIQTFYLCSIREQS